MKARNLSNLADSLVADVVAGLAAAPGVEGELDIVLEMEFFADVDSSGGISLKTPPLPSIPIGGQGGWTQRTGRQGNVSYTLQFKAEISDDSND